MQLPSTLRLALVLALLCFSPALRAQTNPATGTVSGRVTLEGKPAQGVAVLALLDAVSGLPQVRAQAKADAEGNYRLTGLPTGNFKIAVAAREYVGDNDDRRSLQPGLSVSLGEGENLEGQDFTLVRGGVITGRVTNAAGQPLIEETLSLFRLDAKGQKEHFSRTFMPDLKTDDRGVYRIYGLPVGRYLVAAGFDDNAPRFSANPRRLPLTYYPGTVDVAQAKPVEVSAGSETDGVDIRFGARERAAEVIVRVTEAETGRPVPDLFANYTRILPDTASNWPTGRAMASTDSKGELRFEKVPPGRYRVLVQTGRPNSSEYFAEPVPFEVTGEGTNRVEVVVKRGATLSGVLVLDNIRDPALRAQVKQMSLRMFRPFRPAGSVAPPQPAAQVPFDSFVTISDDLSFRTAGLPPGRYQFWASGNGSVAGFNLARIERNGQALPNIFEVSSGEQTSGLRLVLGYSNATLRGQVQISGGSLPPQARLSVGALHKDRTVDIPLGRSAEVDTRGRFVMEFMHAGTYELTVRVSLPPDFPRANLPPALRRPLAKQEVVLGNTGETQVTLTLDLSQQEERR
jgi:hypothetical protein